MTEFEEARTALLRANAQRFDTVASSARAFERLVVHADPLDMYGKWPVRLSASKPSGAGAALLKACGDLSLVVVGDRAKLSAALTETGLPVVAFSPDGRRLP
jgi:hypothetical protein